MKFPPSLGGPHQPDNAHPDPAGSAVERPRAEPLSFELADYPDEIPVPILRQVPMPDFHRSLQAAGVPADGIRIMTPPGGEGDRDRDGIGQPYVLVIVRMANDVYYACSTTTDVSPAFTLRRI